MILHCNVLWMSSPKADLSTTKEEQFNHAAPRAAVLSAHSLLPGRRQRAARARWSSASVGFLAWVGHLQNAYFDQQSIPALDACRTTAAIRRAIPTPGRIRWRRSRSASLPRPRTIPSAARAARGTSRGSTTATTPPPGHPQPVGDAEGTTRFEWVDFDRSLQWQAFQRVIGLLRERGNDVLVVLGPFNEHLLAAENRPTYRKLRDGIAAWLAQNQVPLVVPETLPSALYADASHPLTDGYELLAKRLYANETFREWLRYD